MYTILWYNLIKVFEGTDATRIAAGSENKNIKAGLPAIPYITYQEDITMKKLFLLAAVAAAAYAVTNKDKIVKLKEKACGCNGECDCEAADEDADEE